MLQLLFNYGSYEQDEVTGEVVIRRNAPVRARKQRQQSGVGENATANTRRARYGERTASREPAAQQAPTRASSMYQPPSFARRIHLAAGAGEFDHMFHFRASSNAPTNAHNPSMYQVLPFAAPTSFPAVTRSMNDLPHLRGFLDVRTDISADARPPDQAVSIAELLPPQEIAPPASPVLSWISLSSEVSEP
jgi:hypothetical protein